MTRSRPDPFAAIRMGGPQRPTVVCSLRDILVNQRSDQAAYDERVCRRANRYFDAVLVHADPAFARLEDSFRPRTPLDVPVHYTGFVAPAPAPGWAVDAGAPLPRLLVSAGGGMVGEPLIRAAVQAHGAVHQRLGLRTTVVAGPFLPESAWTWLRRQAEMSPHLDALRRVDDLCLEMGRSTVSLSQGGYNTTMDILRARTPAVVVPFSEGTEDEQRRRTQRLESFGTGPAAGTRTADDRVARHGDRGRHFCAALAVAAVGSRRRCHHRRPSRRARGRPPSPAILEL